MPGYFFVVFLKLLDLISYFSNETFTIFVISLGKILKTNYLLNSIN